MKLAQDFDAIQSSAGLKSPDSIAVIIKDALPYVFGAAGIYLQLNIIGSGFKMMTSSGDPKVMQAGQAKITSSVIGIVILFGSFWIVTLVMQFLGINLDNPIVN